MDALLLGREVEQARATAFVRGLQDGPGVLVVSGDPGIGKTTIWRLVVSRAAESGCRVLSTRPVAAEAKLAFSGLTDLLSSVDDEVFDSLPAPQCEALAAATLRRTRTRGQSEPRAVTAGAAAALRLLAREQPLLVAVDDLQWVDPATARTIEAVVRRLGDEHIGVLVAERSDEVPCRSTALQRAVATDRFERLALSALDDAGVRHLLERQLPAPVSLRTHRRVQDVARGNPFFTVELAGALPREGVTGVAPLTLSPSLRDLVEARVAALPAHACAALLAVAALERPTVELVAVGTGMSGESTMSALEAAAEAGVVELDDGAHPVRFVHPLYAAGVYERATPRMRREVHLRLAGAMTSIELRARHLALGRTDPDAELAALLDRAAQDARRRGAPDSAAVLAVQARRLTPAHETDELARRTVAVARFRFHSGELEPARQLLDELLREDLDPSTRAAAACLLGEIRYHQQGFVDARMLFTQAGSDGSPDPETACRIQMHLAYAAANTDQLESARPHARRALALSAGLQDDALHAEALAVVVVADYMGGQGLDETRLREALALEDPYHQVVMALRPSLIAGLLMLYEGRLAESVVLLEACHHAAVDRGEETDTPMALASLAWAELLRGRLEAAASYGDVAVETARRVGTPTAEGLAAAYLSAVAAYRGDVVAAHAHAEQAMLLTEQTGSALPAMWARWGLGLLALALDDPAAAHAVLEPMTRRVEERGLTEPIVANYLADQIEAMVGIGDLARAERLTDILEECATRLERQWAMVGALRCRALLAAARGDLEAASASAAAARSRCSGLELRLEVARTLFVSGRIERRRRRKHDAAVLLNQALELFDEAGATPWVHRTRAELDRVGPHRTPDAQMSPTERRVAELSATGLTNRDVAARLNISPKTVEANLARVYRKLGISSRAELGAALAAGRTSAAVSDQ